MKPSLCVFTICRNEERDIARALASMLPVADEFVVVDTGSTDDTERVVRETVPPERLHFETFTGASEQNADGTWALWDFAAARNHAIEIAERKRCRWIAWQDSDDELLDTRPLARAMYREDVDGFHAFIEAAGIRWLHFRMWKTEKRVRFKGRIHEYPVIHELRTATCYTTIRHHGAPSKTQEDGNTRNLRILLREWEEHPDARTAFYIACTHRDAGRADEAAEWFRRRIGFGDAFRDEWLFSHLYLSRALRTLKRYAEAVEIMAAARALEPAWAEFIIEDANIAYAAQDWATAIELARPAMGMPIPATVLWREPYAYRDQAPRLISWCHEHMGSLGDAIAWADIAAAQIGHPDEDWARRTDRLKAQLLAANDPPPAILTHERERIALVRPGAIGDILMTLNLIPAFKAAHPDAVVDYFCAAQYGKPDALLPTMLAAGVDHVMDVAGLPAWRKSYDRVINLVGYQVDWAKNDRLSMDRHLLRYFAEEMGLELGEELPSLELPRPRARYLSGFITLQTEAGWSRYKQWPKDRWCDVVRMVGGVPARVVLIGEDQGFTLSESIALVANARLHVGVDSFANHLTHYRWSGHRVPGVILFGSTQPGVLGYPTNINLSAGLECSRMCYRENPAISSMSRGPCVNPLRATYDDPTPHACMDAISVEQVVEAIREALKWLA